MTLPSKRTLLGPLILLVIIGETMIPSGNGLYTPAGFISLYFLYFTLLLTFDGYIARYRPTNLQLVLFTFALYSVLVTGLLHKEIADYILTPQHSLFITFIRVQASFFTLYAYTLINRFLPAPKQPSLKKGLIGLGLYALVLSPSLKFGFPAMAEAFEIAPGLCLGFSLLAVAALIVALRPAKKTTTAKIGLLPLSIGFFGLSFIPLVPVFVVYIIGMIVITLILLSKARFRNSTVR